MSDELRTLLTALEDIDTQIHHLLEDIKAAEEIDVTLKANAIQTLRQTRSEMDPALLAIRQRRDAPSTPNDDSVTVQWTPADKPPQRLIIDSSHNNESYSCRTLEWDGLGWRPHSRDDVDDFAIHAPTASRRPTPTDPPRLETLREQLRGTWRQSEPLALVFESTVRAEPGVVVDVDGDLRYRERDAEQWYEITDDGLQNYLTQRGQPTLMPLSETSLSRPQFADNLSGDSGSPPNK